MELSRSGIARTSILGSKSSVFALSKPLSIRIRRNASLEVLAPSPTPLCCLQPRHGQLNRPLQSLLDDQTLLLPTSSSTASCLIGSVQASILPELHIESLPIVDSSSYRQLHLSLFTSSPSRLSNLLISRQSPTSFLLPSTVLLSSRSGTEVVS